MDSENPNPPRKYYEEQFGDRIRAISKGGDAPKPASTGSGGSDGNSGKGFGSVGVVILLVIVGVLRGLSSSGSRNATPPRVEMPRLQVPQVPQVPHFDPGLQGQGFVRPDLDPAGQHKHFQDLQAEVRRLMKEMEQKRQRNQDRAEPEGLPEPGPAR